MTPKDPDHPKFLNIGGSVRILKSKIFFVGINLAALIAIYVANGRFDLWGYAFMGVLTASLIPGFFLVKQCWQQLWRDAEANRCINPEKTLTIFFQLMSWSGIAKMLSEMSHQFIHANDQSVFHRPEIWFAAQFVSLCLLYYVAESLAKRVVTWWQNRHLSQTACEHKSDG